MLIHEFVLVNSIPDKINYRDYKKSEFTEISDKFILDNCRTIQKVDFLSENMDNIVGLDYHGITIIDFEAAKKLEKKLFEDCIHSEDLSKLLLILSKVDKGEYIIHFGI